MNGTEEEKELYTKFIKYYKKVWINSNYIRFDLSTEKDLLDRTNNICEGFNNTLSKYMEIYKPRIAYFIDKIKSITVKNFKDVVNSMVNDTGDNNLYNSLYNQIYNFLYNFHRKYKNNLFFNNILQLENDFKDEFNLISKKSFLMYYSSDDAEELWK